MRGLGARGKKALLEKLILAGFPHPGPEQPVSEFRLIERSLERIQRRVDRALGSVAREIAAVKQRLRIAHGFPASGSCPPELSLNRSGCINPVMFIAICCAGKAQTSPPLLNARIIPEGAGMTNSL